MSKEGFAEPLLAKATAWNGGRVPDIVWCVAGMSIPGLFASQDLETLRRQTNLNFFGQAELAHAAIRAWLQEGSGLSDGAAAISNGHLSETSNSQSNGHASTAALTPTKANAPLPKRHLIFTSSTAAFYTIVGYASYSPSKWALRGLCDTLAQDTMLYKAAGLADIRVATVFPGTMTSPGFERENETKPAITLELERDDPRQHPDQAARDALRGLEKGKYQVCIGWLGFLMRWGVIGGVERNNWLVDIVMAFVVSVAWMYVQWDQNSRIRAHGRKEGRALLPEGIGAGKGP